MLLRLKTDGAARELAWEDFFKTYVPIIRSFARKLGVTGEDADDVVQEVLKGFYQVSPRFIYDPTRGRFRGYLKICTTRVMADLLARRVRVAGTPIDKIDPAAEPIEEAWADAWETEQLNRALATVREHYSSRPDMTTTFQAFEMNVLFQHAAKDVAQELNISVESVHAAKSRITKAVRVQMQRQLEITG